MSTRSSDLRALLAITLLALSVGVGACGSCSGSGDATSVEVDADPSVHVKWDAKRHRRLAAMASAPDASADLATDASGRD